MWNAYRSQPAGSQRAACRSLREQGNRAGAHRRAGSRRAGSQREDSRRAACCSQRAGSRQEGRQQAGSQQEDSRRAACCKLEERHQQAGSQREDSQQAGSQREACRSQREAGSHQQAGNHTLRRVWQECRGERERALWAPASRELVPAGGAAAAPATASALLVLLVIHIERLTTPWLFLLVRCSCRSRG